MPFDLPLKCVLSASFWSFFLYCRRHQSYGDVIVCQGLNLLTLHKSHTRNIMVLNQFSQHCALSCFLFIYYYHIGPTMVWGRGGGQPFPPSTSSTRQFLQFPLSCSLVSANENGGQALFAGILTALLDFLVGCNLHRVALGGVFFPGSSCA